MGGGPGDGCAVTVQAERPRWLPPAESIPWRATVRSVPRHGQPGQHKLRYAAHRRLGHVPSRTTLRHELCLVSNHSLVVSRHGGSFRRHGLGLE